MNTGEKEKDAILDAFAAKDWQRAFDISTSLAQTGDYFAQGMLASLYNDGLGCQRDPEQAFALWHIVAENGHPDAQYSVARCYEDGNGVPQDLIKAYYWYQQAAKSGDSESEVSIKRLATVLTTEEIQIANSLKQNA